MFLEHWDIDLHQQPDQQKRIQTASTSSVTPMAIDHDNCIGTFKGSGKNPYCATLVSCTCGDFIRRRLPCKHMYRLALELGHIKRDFDAGINKNDVLTLLESLAEDSQYLLHELLYLDLYADIHEFFLHRSEHSTPLFSTGICIENLNSYSTSASKQPVSILRANLFSTQIASLPSKNCQKKTMVKWIDQMENTNPSLLEKNYIVMEFSPEFSVYKHKGYRYLNKKLYPSIIEEEHITTISFSIKD